MKKQLLTFVLLFVTHALTFAQAPAKEALNNFALYTRKNDFSYLEKAKGFIDQSFKVKKDSLNYRLNLTKGLIYSSLAFADSTKKLSYKKDPIDITLETLNLIKAKKVNSEFQSEVDFVMLQLKKAGLVRANKAMKAFKYADAYKAYSFVDSLDSDVYLVKHNLALLSEQLGYQSKAIIYYEQLIDNKDKAKPEYFLALSNLYDIRDPNLSLEVLRAGRRLFPKHKDLLFKEINKYADNESYQMVEALIYEALSLEPDNVSLNYLAGFSLDVSGKRNKAEQYYKKVVSLDGNSFEGNYSLGLLYLNSYLSSTSGKEKDLELASKYLTQASEIDPNSSNVLKALKVLYDTTGDMVELEKTNNKLKQFILN